MISIVELAIPIMAPLPFEDEHSVLYAECLDELRCLPFLSASEPRFEGACFNVQVLDTPEDEPLLSEKWKSQDGVRSYSLLKLTIDASACIESIRRESEGRSQAEQVELCQFLVMQFVEYELNLLLLATNIAKPGALSAVEGYSFLNGEFVAKQNHFLRKISLRLSKHPLKQAGHNF